ncbi:MAG: gliding motility-associated C-terminal domain-containing protein [Flavisolibacter sp.]
MYLFFCLQSVDSFSQCSPVTGPPPSNLFFNTGSNGTSGTLPPGAADFHWKVAVDDINANYSAAIVMDSLPPDYYRSSFTDCRWISISANGSHSGNRHYFFKIDFSLPCANTCGVSYNNDHNFCLSLDLFADNSIYEIYVNGVPQSNNLAHIIPILPDPFHAVGMGPQGNLPVSLCNNWKAGANTLIIELASSGPITGLLAQASTIFPQTVSNFIIDSICQGDTYQFGTQSLNHAGYTFQTFHLPSGCDSTVALQLMVKPTITTSIDHSICEGQSFLGYGSAGTYTDTFTATNGCDSLRVLHLTLLSLPKPNLGINPVLCSGDSLVLDPGTFLSYVWQDGSTRKNFTVTKPGLYSVMVTNICGSAKQDVIVQEKECAINFPSAFTPNGDGKNDDFKILTSYSFESYHLFIYNRWGQKVFETTDPLKPWNGSVNNKPQQTDIFIWQCSYTRQNRSGQLKGTVALIR